MGKKSADAAARNKESRAIIVEALRKTMQEQVDRHLSIDGINELGEPALMGLCKEACQLLGLKKRSVKTSTHATTQKDIMSFHEVFSNVDGKTLIAEFYATVQESVRKNVENRINTVASATCPVPSRKCDIGERPTLRFTESQAARWIACGGDLRVSLQFTHIVAIAQGRLPTSKHDDLSHLCHNKLCVQHTVWESKANNAERNNCVAAKHCLGSHDGVPCAFQPEGNGLALLPDISL